MRGTLIQHHRDIDRLLSQTRRIAVLGIKPEHRSPQPAYMIPAYMHRAGYEVIPVPVYYPDVTEILGKPVFRDLKVIPTRIDLLNVFRKSQDLPPHLDDILAVKPRVVWLQSGIHDDVFAEQLVAAGMDVVQDQCLMVEHRRWRAAQG
ncbi:MAG: CoA-binding protein [Lysobacter sp.]|nr:CoA-binding protein [Lysobacter sp.]